MSLEGGDRIAALKNPGWSEMVEGSPAGVDPGAITPGLGRHQLLELLPAAGEEPAVAAGRNPRREAFEASAGVVEAGYGRLEDLTQGGGQTGGSSQPFRPAQRSAIARAPGIWNSTPR